MATKKTVLIVRFLREASARGSKGALVSASKTAGRLNEGSNLWTGGRFRNRARNTLLRHGAVDTQVPSANPEWIAAIADR